jgi:uncharacterized protein
MAIKINSFMYLRYSGSVIALIFCSVFTVNAQQVTSVVKVPSQTTYLEPNEIKVDGLLGDVITADRKGRIAALPKWKDGELITMFSKEVKNKHDKMDWYGEHGGKWLYTASHAAKHSKDKELETLVIQTADYLVKQQDADGYLGNYGPTVRLTNDAISHKRSWDVWNLGYMTLGLLQTNRYYPNPNYLNAAKSIGELFIRMYGDGKHNITDYGTRRGVSATIILDPVVELYKVTKDARYLNLAETIIKQAEAKEDHRIITAGKNNIDMEFVGDGKIYQIIWNLAGVVKLYEVTGNPEYLKAATNIWQNITDFHLNITGGPWGGVGKHMECFNRKNYWSPYGLVETCSTMSWIQLNKELLRLTGDAKYAQAIEKSAYNSLLGARFPNGVDWSYHSFNNGAWSVANFNDCCPSSGALALEELPALIYSKRENGIALNLFTASEANVSMTKGNVRIAQKTQYPFDGHIQIDVSPAREEAFAIFIRIPEWVSGAVFKVNGKLIDAMAVKSGEYFSINRSWKSKDMIEIEFPFELRVEQKAEELEGPQNAGEISRTTWFSLSRGPLVFAANGLIDGKDRERALDVDLKNAVSLFNAVNPPEGVDGPAYELKVPGVQPLLFVPYFAAGGMKKGAWRLTWLQTGIR